MAPAISVEEYPNLVRSLNVGSPIAEDDALLHEARIETSVFSEIMDDRVDIIRGTKGSGKSALYRIFTKFLADLMLENYQVIIVKAEDTTGDPIFLKFKPQFEQLDEVDFQNFWRIYFLSLIESQILSQAKYQSAFASAESEIKDFRKQAKENGFPIIDKTFSPQGIIGWVLSKIPKPKSIGTKVGEVETTLELDTASVQQEERVPLFVSSLHDALVRALVKCKLSLWLMVDRLDEVFPRRSEVERKALRGLLRTTTAFRDSRLRIKIFLRDDIFDSITDVSGGFPALTHVVSRCSDTLKWNKDQILHLIVNRIYASRTLTKYFSIDKDALQTNPEHRSKAFYAIFPYKLRRGINQSDTLDWIYKHCEDANGVVTPRDVIDLINFAKRHQQDAFQAHKTEMPSLLSSVSILYGHQRMSEKKRETYLKAEFDHFWKFIERFENRRAEYDERAMRSILGSDWRKVAQDLRSIGFIRFNPRSETYTVPFVYRHCLRIRQGREASSSPQHH